MPMNGLRVNLFLGEGDVLTVWLSPAMMSAMSVLHIN